MKTGPRHSLDREITIHLYRAIEEENHPDDVGDGLREIGLDPKVRQKNPVTSDVWMLVLNMAQNHAQHAAIGTALLGLVTLWLKQRNGRRVEIERPGLKVKASNASDLREALAALHNYDEVTLTLNNGNPPKPATKKKAAPPSQKKSK